MSDENSQIMGWLKDLFTFDSDEDGYTTDEDRYPSDWDSRRKEVYRADGYTCQICGSGGGPTGNTELHAHHKIPISEGGSHKKGNLTTLCKECHNGIHNGDLNLSGNYNVALEVAWLVRDVEEIDDAERVAVSEAGRRLNEADMDYVEVEVGSTPCPACSGPFDSAFIAADTALIGLGIDFDVFSADSPVDASQIAESEVGAALGDVPIKVINVSDKQ